MVSRIMRRMKDILKAVLNITPHIILPRLPYRYPKHFLICKLYIVWKISINEISSKDCYMKFIVYSEKVNYFTFEILILLFIKKIFVHKLFNIRMRFYTNIF